MAEQNLSVSNFTESVEPLLKVLQEKFGDSLCVSDIRDVLGKQYVDLVQEGGGVHGIALAGYTYVLEKMNMGFMKMAGTSAGSINTLLLNAVYTKDEARLLTNKGRVINEDAYYETRSEKVLEYLAEKDLSALVDGHPRWRKLLLAVFSPKTGGASVRRQINMHRNMGKFGIASLLFLLISSIALVFYDQNNRLHLFLQLITVFATISLIVGICFFLGRIVLARMLYKYSEHLGINPGKNFEDWISDILKENGIETVEALNEKLTVEKEVLKPSYQACVPTVSTPSNTNIELSESTIGLLERIRNLKVNIDSCIADLVVLLNPDPNTLKSEQKEGLELVMNAFEERLRQDEVVTRELVIVTSDVTHGIKVEFPGMHKLYWGNNYGISPAKYVRASMSIPLFFKPFEVKFNPADMYVIRQEWANFTKVQKNLDNCAIFVDGGLLSNFPINVFYNPDMPVPRKPTFGIKLEYEDSTSSKRIKNISEFMGSIISTMRYFYDRDFSLKHDLYQKTVRSIDTGGIHWLNFNLTNQEKLELFYRGALAATIFLCKHKMTESEVQNLMRLGFNVSSGDYKFSIYPGEEPSFNIEDCLLGNVTFEWQGYKRERLLDRIMKDIKKQEIKRGASLQTVPLKSPSVDIHEQKESHPIGQP
jgi:NTE family protein